MNPTAQQDAVSSSVGTQSLHKEMKSSTEVDAGINMKPSLPENEVEESQNRATNYITGLRLRSITAALCLSLFLTNLEIPIVSTSIVGITDRLKGFDESSWIVTAYLLTYIGFLIIFAKMSDIFGRKLLLCSCIMVFMIFSGACGASQTTTQLIILRAFQGLGGSGIYSICMVMLLELVPSAKYAKYTSGVSVVFSLSLLLGPILGGAINDSSSSSAWRWVFLLNVPAGAIAFALLFIFLPHNFPNQGSASHRGREFRDIFTASSLNKVDILGAALLLTATIFLVTALEEAGVAFSWKSGLVISLLVLSGLLWVVFLIWEYRVTRAENNPEPVFPWRYMESRVWMGMLLNAFCLGPPFTVSIFQIAQRFQVVNSVSPLSGGLRLVPFSFASPVGSVVSAIIAGKAKLPPIYLVLFASCLQVLGFSLLSTIPTGIHVSKAQYGYEVIAGFGVGINISTLILMTPFIVEKRDQATAVGSVAQFRYMGGAVGLGIATNVLNSYVSSKLSTFLTLEQVSAVLETSAAISLLPTEVQDRVRMVFAAGYNNQMKVVLGFAAAQIPATLLMWQRKQITV